MAVLTLWPHNGYQRCGLRVRHGRLPETEEGSHMFRQFTDDTAHLSDDEVLARLVKLPESEEEWLSCDEPPKLMAALLEGSQRSTVRKIRLYACAAAKLYLSTH